MPFVSSWCRVSAGKVWSNGNLRFDYDPGDSGVFLAKWYQAERTEYPKFYKMDRLCQLGLLSAEALLEGQNLSDRYTPQKVGVVLANAASSLDTDQRYARTMQTMPSPAQFVYTLPNIVIGELCIRHGFQGENIFFVFDDFDAGRLTDYVDLLLNEAGMDAVVAGWVECLDQRCDALLYLAERQTANNSIIHHTSHILKLYGSFDAGT